VDYFYATSCDHSGLHTALQHETFWMYPVLLSVKYGFSELVQRIFKYDSMQNASLTPDKELNI